MEKRNYKSEVLDIVKTKDWDRARWSNDINLYYYIKRHKDTNENCRIIWEHINQQSRDFELEISEIIETKDWDRARCSNDINLYGYIKRHKDTNENCRIIWEHISRQSKDFKTEVLEIIETKNWDRARWSNNTNLYQYVKDHKDTDENCKIIWEHIKAETRDLKSEILEIVETKNWDRARWSNDRNLYLYIYCHRDTDKNSKTIWAHVKLKKDHESEIPEIIRTKDWDRAKKSNDKSLYLYIRCHKDDDKNCKIIWEHIKTETRDFKSEILEIIRTKDWDRTRWSNDRNLYRYIRQYKDTDENCKAIWEHIKIEKHCPYTIKDYLSDYFKHGKPKRDNHLRVWFYEQIRKKNNQSCIDIKNLIIAADTYKDPVALETLDLIKNHLEKEG
jgi:hypothetical protein